MTTATLRPAMVPTKFRPHQVTAEGGVTKIWVMDGKRDQLPTAFALMATTVPAKVCIRLTGGCANMSPDDKLELVKYFSKGFGQKYRGLFFTGGTRQATAEGDIDPMITDIPAYLVPENPGSKALGTAPRTGQMQIVEDSRFELHEGVGLNPSQAGVVIVQDGPEKPSDWDGDLAIYFDLMQNLRDNAGFSAVGVIAWNGGGVTGKEIMESARRGWPTILVKGSGRKCDEIIGKLEAGDSELMSQLPAEHQMIVVDKSDPAQLTAALAKHGFIA